MPPKVQRGVGIAWYRRNKYKQCLKIFHDASGMPDTFREWQQNAVATEASVRSSGFEPVRVDIDPNTFPPWCKRNGFKRIDHEARAAYGNLKAFEYLEERERKRRRK